eukprot:CAMPEP_0175050266 /NCGR_PEP_ID=MMETSP0052_2-20121109/7169_1 /TAXON_ID=51329 ORGANISM="Polytomella parva, Strain SAG 63-3" /NCGR_SAMPLE_ID=MMETSP0052_2 /ASSEMBLY_ACC=CAM_ASM_000194 /LENGTH=336 /DNA_ID=CAMNT_0016314461 /DNA_START=219 /DNA_END=1226 /DNA_ORIENTATION=-
MMVGQQNQALRRRIEELEVLAAGERQETLKSLEKLMHYNEMKALRDHQLQEQEIQVLNVNNSYLQQLYKSLLQRHTLLLGAFKDVMDVTFEDYISGEINKGTQSQLKVIPKETEANVEVLQSRNEELISENTSIKKINAAFNNIMSIKLEEIGKLEAHVSSLTMNAEKSSAKIQELETARDTLDKALKESTQSLSEKAKELSEMELQYHTEKRRLEDELCAFRNTNEMLNEKLKKEEREKPILSKKIKSLEDTNLSLTKTIPVKQEEMGNLKTYVSTLTMNVEKSSTKIRELEAIRDTLDKALKESTQSLSVKVKELSEMQLQYNTEKRRLDDELS